MIKVLCGMLQIYANLRVHLVKEPPIIKFGVKTSGLSPMQAIAGIMKYGIPKSTPENDVPKEASGVDLDKFGVDLGLP